MTTRKSNALAALLGCFIYVVVWLVCLVATWSLVAAVVYFTWTALSS